MIRLASTLFLVCCCAAAPVDAGAVPASTTQASPSAASTPSPSFRDDGARRLWEAAVAHRAALDDELLEYQAVVRQRFGVALRMPLKDRTLYRAEGATRVLWSRDGTTVVQLLGGREQTPNSEAKGVADLGLFDLAYDPVDDPLFLGLVETDTGIERDADDFRFEHPLEPANRGGYVFATGDTLTVSLPDGERIQVVELEVVPTVADVHRMVGSLWIEPGTGALVRAVYRLSETFDAFRDVPDLQEDDEELRYLPGLLRPITLDLEMVAVEYTWWEGDIWLPRLLRAEGTARAGVLRAPATLEFSYQVEDVLTRTAAEERVSAAGPPVDSVHFSTRAEAMTFLAGRLGDVEGHTYRVSPSARTAERREGGGGGRRRTLLHLVPEDSTVLLDSPHLPEPVWRPGGAFADADELAAWRDLLGDLPTPPVQGLPRTFRWGLQRSDLVRYNRVEALSVGARGELRPQTSVGPLTLGGTVRFGVADRVPNLHARITRETLARRLTLSGYHELVPVDEAGRALGPGNSLTALLFGRDDGDYYRRSGASLTWTPPAARRSSFEVQASAEYHRPVSRGTNVSLWHLPSDSWRFRDNLRAREGWEYGGRVMLRPWWGTDPRLVQGGFEVMVRGGEGDWRYAQLSLEPRLAVPLVSGLRLGLEAGAGTSWGEPPPQRLFLLGGAHSLRGYGPRTFSAHTYLRTRAELGRHLSFGTVSLFSDAGWGAAERRSPDADEVLYSAGVGLSILDGLIRLDGAWALRAPRAFRLEFYLDGIL